jgi:hypothetical protein
MTQTTPRDIKQILHDTIAAYNRADRIAIATGRLEGWIRMPTGERLTGPWDFRKIWIQDEEGWRMAPDAELPAIRE